MKGLLVDDEPAFHLHIPSLNPAYKFAASPALASEHSSHELEPKFQGALSFPSSNCTCMPSSEEKSPTGLACFDKYMCNLAELSSWDMHHLGSMIVPEGDKRQTMDESMCRRMGATNGDNSQGSGHVGDLQASMEAMKVNHMPGFKYYMGIERDYGSNIQAPIAPLMGRHPGSDDGNYVDDHPGHASMFALSCMSPPGDNSFWRFLPSNHEEHSTDFFSSDEFRMYEFKVRRCMRGRSHDWTECPFAHPGEKARRRDPRRFHYSGTACPDFRRGTCRRGDSCELSHGVFECWLHPARYRTQLCKDGKSCKRRVCFFAHSSSQLRYVSPDLIPDNGFTLRSPLASPSTDAMASYSDVLYKHLPFFANNSSPVRQGSPGGYGGDVLFDDFSPVNIHGFPHDGMHEDFFSFAVHSKRAQNDKTFVNFNGKNGHGRGVSMDDISNHVKLNSHSYMPSSNGYHFAEEFDHDGSHGHSLYPYTSSHPSPDSPSLKTSQAHVNLRNQLALASLTSNIDQIMSPTSTLIGHVFSPPLLSPPLSPTDSPPVSPGAAFSSWSTLSRKLATLSGQPLSHGLAPGMDANPMIANGTSPSVSQFHASLLANLAHSNGAPALFANTRGPSPLSTNSLADKKQELDRPSSMPTSQELMEDESLQTDAYPAHHAMAHLISTLQRMEVRGATTNVKNGRRPYSPQSSRNMPKSRIDAWDGNGVGSNQRVESGQGLRAKIYGKIGRDAGVDNENPDLGWVNELVK